MERGGKRVEELVVVVGCSDEVRVWERGSSNMESRIVARGVDDSRLRPRGWWVVEAEVTVELPTLSSMLVELPSASSSSSCE